MLRIVEIKALSNGAHRNQSYPGFVPEGWALIPADMDTPNFPFGEVEAAEINGVMTVTKWTPGEMPEVTEEDVPGDGGSDVWAELDVAYQEGVNSAYDS